MTTAYEAYTTVRRGDPYTVGVMELAQPAEEMWTPEGCDAGRGAAAATVIADRAGIHIRLRGVDRDALVAEVDRLAAAIAAGTPVPVDGLPGVHGG